MSPTPSFNAAPPSQDCVALVVAAGRGSRAGSDTPKQYITIAGEPLIRRTLRAFCLHPGIDAVLPVIHPDDTELFADAAQGLDVMSPVSGGATRQESVRFGLERLAGLSPAPRRVLIHDAARAFVSGDLISSVLEALDHHTGVLPAPALAA